MKFLSDEKLLILGAAGMIGSNMVQTAAMLGLTPNICLYDIFEPGLKGVLAEMDHCAFEGINLTATVYGPAFSFLYQKFGFASSFLAHATNNVFSIVVNYMQMTLKQ